MILYGAVFIAIDHLPLHHLGAETEHYMEKYMETCTFCDFMYLLTESMQVPCNFSITDQFPTQNDVMVYGRLIGQQ